MWCGFHHTLSAATIESVQINDEYGSFRDRNPETGSKLTLSDGAVFGNAIHPLTRYFNLEDVGELWEIGSFNVVWLETFFSQQARALRNFIVFEFQIYQFLVARFQLKKWETKKDPGQLRVSSIISNLESKKNESNPRITQRSLVLEVTGITYL